MCVHACTASCMHGRWPRNLCGCMCTCMSGCGHMLKQGTHMPLNTPAVVQSMCTHTCVGMYTCVVIRHTRTHACLQVWAHVYPYIDACGCIASVGTHMHAHKHGPTLVCTCVGMCQGCTPVGVCPTVLPLPQVWRCSVQEQSRQKPPLPGTRCDRWELG